MKTVVRYLVEPNAAEYGDNFFRLDDLGGAVQRRLSSSRWAASTSQDRHPDVTSFVAARAIHVLSVVLWIGGVAFVTTVLIPAIRRMPSDNQRIELFEQIESQFALQARVTTVLAGTSGLYMLHFMEAWSRYLDPSFWWIHLMTLVWFVFTVVLFVLEPLFLHRLFNEAVRRDSVRAFRILHRMHWVLLTLSTVAIVGAVAGTRGFL